MQSKALVQLLKKTWASPVFGDSFGPDIAAKTPQVMEQMQAIAQGFSTQMIAHLRVGMPELSERQVKKIVDQMMPKTVSFCPALTAGELDDMPRLTAFAVAIGLMYWGDQTMDRGDKAMPFAIQLYGDQKAEVPENIRPLVKARLKSIKRITDTIHTFALPPDAPYVVPCYREQVLMNEVELHHLSLAYKDATDKPGFIAEHAARLAKIMTIDAGFPSVSSSLYAIYRQHDASLPSLAEVYSDPTMVELLQICNAVVRMADELGDWEMDAGHNPKWGVFTINLFNQAHPKLTDEFRKLAGITDRMQLEGLLRAFTHFSEDRKGHGDFLMKLFFDHARQYIAAIPSPTAERFALYIQLCKRVLEIGHVNQAGDMHMAS